MTGNFSIFYHTLHLIQIIFFFFSLRIFSLCVKLSHKIMLICKILIPRSSPRSYLPNNAGKATNSSQNLNKVHWRPVVGCIWLSLVQRDFKKTKSPVICWIFKNSLWSRLCSIVIKFFSSISKRNRTEISKFILQETNMILLYPKR